jgi:hypothetical protein
MSSRNDTILVTEDLISHLEKAFPAKPYQPGMPMEEVAYAQGTQEPIIHLKQMLHKRNKRGR